MKNPMPWRCASRCMSDRKVIIPAGGEQRVDWRVSVKEEGQAVVRMKAVTDEESDAMEMRFPVYVRSEGHHPRRGRAARGLARERQGGRSSGGAHEGGHR